MPTNSHIFNKFTGYTAADCDCKWCRYNGGKAKGCLVEVCCCLEERIQAGCDLTRGADGYRHKKDTVSLVI